MILVLSRKHLIEKFCTSVRGILRDQDQRPHVAITLQLLYNDVTDLCFVTFFFNAYHQCAVSVQLYNMYSM